MYGKLADAGFDEIPCGSNHDTDKNFGVMVPFCDKVIAPERLKGFMTAPWFATVPYMEKRLLRAVDQVEAAMKARAGRRK